MLENIKIRLSEWDWQSQKVWKLRVPDLINKIDTGYFRTKKVTLDISVICLEDYSFDCPTVFEFALHMKLVENSNLKYPVVLSSRGTIIDWRHRLVKAILAWKKTLEWVMILDDLQHLLSDD